MIKMLKRISTVSLLFMYCATTFGQSSDDARTPRHTIGLNTRGLFDKVLNDSTEDRYTTPYLLTYSYDMGSLVLRAGFGPDYQSQTVVHDGFTDSEEQTYLRLDGRIGAGIKILEDHRWQAIAGVDIIAGYLRDRTISDSGFDRITDQFETKSFGGGPFVEFSYHLSERISLGAESALYWRHEKTTHTELFENFPDFNNVLSKNSGSQLDLTLPNTVYIRIHF